MKKSTVSKILLHASFGILITLGFLLLFSALWFTRNFGASVGFDSIIFTLFSDLHGTDTSVIESFLLWGALPTVLSSAALILLWVFLPHLVKKLKESWSRFVFRTIAMGLAGILFISMLGFAVHRVKLVDYLVMQSNSTRLFDDYYVDPDNVNITFPEQKRNLIYIYLESMEVTFADKENNGALDDNFIPELTGLAQQNVNFSHADGFGGGQTTTGSTWTIAAAVSQTAGIPLCLPDDIWENGLNKFALVMPGVTTISDILAKNGYTQALMMGSNSEFAGQKKYYQQHGTDYVYDLLSARQDGLLPQEDYHDGFWGMEDFYLYEYAKEKLKILAEGEEPFALSMYTIDTHSPYGNMCRLCWNRRGSGLSAQERKHMIFEDVLSCSSRQLSDFIVWLEAQDFYENTTVIIVGDHYSMNNLYIRDVVGLDYTRRTYNCILNAPQDPTREKNREFTTLDMFPTTLAALGCQIEGDRLGLGTNLFSEKDTLCETLGFDYLNREIGTHSQYYNEKFLYTEKKRQ